MRPAPLPRGRAMYSHTSVLKVTIDNDLAGMSQTKYPLAM